MKELTEEQKQVLITNTINDWNKIVTITKNGVETKQDNLVRNNGCITNSKLSLRTGLREEEFIPYQQLIELKNSEILASNYFNKIR